MTLDRGMPLEPRDYAALAARWIPRELAEQAMLRRVDDAEGATIVGKNGSGNYAGVIIPYSLPGPFLVRSYRLRRDHPEVDQAGKAREKYMAEPAAGNKLYFAPGTDPAWLDDASLPIVIVEGEFKTLSLSRLGRHGLSDAAERPRFLSVGLSGTWNWTGKTGITEDSTGTRVTQKGPIPDLGLITWKSRLVVILFDADVASNDQVQRARAALTAELKKRGANVRWVFWPKVLPAGVKGIDDFLAAEGPEAALDLIRSARAEKPTAEHQAKAVRQFTALREDLYRLDIPDLGITFEIDRLRREHQELIGELCVRCDLPGARSYDGNLSIADFNLSSARARTERAKLLTDRSKTSELDWLQMLEEFCQRVLQAEREGKPGVDLRTVADAESDDDIDVIGLPVPRLDPTILFGDGGTAKSYLALYQAGLMAQQGLKVAYFDWEWTQEKQKGRLRKLFGNDMPLVIYARCDRPLVSEVDRLRRIVREHGIEYSFFDSVAYACDGPPEAAEVAMRYFRCVRQIGCGSHHVAHIRAEMGDQKPFGSIFWHNSARSTWFVEKSQQNSEAILDVALHNRKVNEGALHSALGFRITFDEKRTTFTRNNVADNADLAIKLTLKERMYHLLVRRTMTPAEIAEELEAKVDSIERIQRRYQKLFIIRPDGKFGVAQRSLLA